MQALVVFASLCHWNFSPASIPATLDLSNATKEIHYRLTLYGYNTFCTHIT